MLALLCQKAALDLLVDHRPLDEKTMYLVSHTAGFAMKRGLESSRGISSCQACESVERRLADSWDVFRTVPVTFFSICKYRNLSRSLLCS